MLQVFQGKMSTINRKYEIIAGSTTFVIPTSYTMKQKRNPRCALKKKQFLQELEARGVTVEKVRGEGLYGAFNITFKSDAWDILEKAWRTFDMKAWVSINFFRKASLILCPPDVLIRPIVKEAASIVYHYSTLPVEDFVENAFPPIGPPLPAPPGTVIMHSGTVTLRKLIERIQKPPPDYPTIHNLECGSYMCTVILFWANILFEIIVMKE